MKKPLLSIVLITEEEPSLTFKRALKSALQQTYENKEIFTVNGNPYNSPYTQSLLEDLAPYPEVEFLQPEQIGTKAAYRNLALERVQGQYVAYMEGRDEWLPDKAALQVGQLETKKGAVVSCANGFINYARQGRVTGTELFSGVTFGVRRLLLEEPVRKCSQLVYKTDVLRRHGGFDERFEVLADLDWFLSWRENYEILFSPAVLFTTEGDSGRKRIHGCFKDRQSIITKYSDLFLVNPRLASDYYALLGKQTLGKGDWFYAIIYFSLAFFQAPLRFGVNLISFLYGKTRQWLRQVILTTIAFLRMSRLGGRMAKRGYGAPNCSTSLPDTAAEVFAGFPAFHFAGNKGLLEAIIPGRVRTIKRALFFSCPDLVSVTIPATVTRIEARAFQDCPQLAEVHFLPGSRLDTIGSYAFAGCRALKELQLPGGLAFLGRGAFLGCEQLKRFTFDGRAFFPSVISVLPPYVFAGCLMLQEVLFEPGSMLEVIGRGAFRGCKSLSTLLLTGVVKSIGAFAFWGCESLKELGMPLLDAVGSIGSHAFYGCARLEEIQVPYVLKRINRRTYYGCSAAKSVIIPAGVSLIKRQAFARCTLLGEVLLMNELTYYSSSAFPKETKITIYRPKPGQD